MLCPPHSYSGVLLQCAYVYQSQQRGVPAWGRVRLQTPPGTARTIDPGSMYLGISISFQLKLPLPLSPKDMVK